MHIHPTALIDPKAKLDSTVEVGAYSIIGPDVSIAAGTKIGPHVIIQGHTTIGRDNDFHAFSSIGGPPQDKKYGGEVTYLEIGDRNLVREFCTFNCGTVQDRGITKIGSDNWFLAYVHVAHDCTVGNHTVFSNNAALAGHVEVGDWVIMSGFSAVHQFCKIGPHAFVGMNTSLTQDVPPFVLVSGNPAQAHGANLEGLKRRGFSREQLNAIRQSYKLIYKSGLTLDEAKTALDQHAAELDADAAAQVRLMRNFLDTSARGIAR
ncbi:acyl-ACP--UDP-N-acetylglucosamine O-acyltransferase [Undibacterium sp. TS12]|uniref:acyl-ACP--UDP-N-acetylglucosamine O-acyltransferase n=1 Tax=Undibacterium sp. TS12 TaxID=2908202 RepID=UPI001F4D3030|nr:acyl-ACP--UDP-N-acetylglucosamine O-acyltransferase [Undibacterium sp. TS12]MCH8618535.1 acyl-ACP--UDP-N-acetylglucosamine O-acyltransferase [Undibacterium sp. TS12]